MVSYLTDVKKKEKTENIISLIIIKIVINEEHVLEHQIMIKIYNMRSWCCLWRRKKNLIMFSLNNDKKSSSMKKKNSRKWDHHVVCDGERKNLIMFLWMLLNHIIMNDIPGLTFLIEKWMDFSSYAQAEKKIFPLNTFSVNIFKK